MHSYQKYKRNLLEKLERDDRKSMIYLLEKDLTDRLKSYKNKDAYWTEVNKIIEALRTVGHDLWSHDYDGESKELWGWNYMDMKTAGFLQIMFDFNSEVQIFWREDS